MCLSTGEPGSGLTGTVRTNRPVFLASLLAFVAAITATVLWHELGHGTMAKLLGYDPVIYSGREDDPATTTRDSVLIAAAGPVLSLVTGVALLAALRRSRPGQRPGTLLLAWLGLLGVETFAGYLLTAPFFSGGDVGRILALWQAPFAVALVVMLLGLVGVIGVAWLAVGVFARLMPGQPERPTDLRLFLRQAAVLPWLVGTVVVLLLSLPLDDPFGPLATATSGLFSLVAMGLTARRFPQLPALGARVSSRSVVVLVVVAVLVLLVNRLVFRNGLQL